MIAVCATAKVDYPGTRLVYSKGALHSDNDEPALVLNSSAKNMHLPIYVSDLKASGLFGLQSYSAAWAQRTALGRRLREKQDYDLEAPMVRCWYAHGEFHRDFGPAVVGYDAAGVDAFWLKYDQSVLGGSPLNTFNGNKMPADDPLANAVFPCAPGAIVCAFSTKHARVQIQHDTDHCIVFGLQAASPQVVFTRCRAGR